MLTSLLQRATQCKSCWPVLKASVAEARAWVGIGLSGLVGEVGLGAEKHGGGDEKIYYPIAWLPPGHDPGAGGGVPGVATLARQQGR